MPDANANPQPVSPVIVPDSPLAAILLDAINRSSAANEKSSNDTMAACQGLNDHLLNKTIPTTTQPTTLPTDTPK